MVLQRKSRLTKFQIIVTFSVKPSKFDFSLSFKKPSYLEVDFAREDADQGGNPVHANKRLPAITFHPFTVKANLFLNFIICDI
jgi:hypothetical protein